jgi:hypothetical protein
MSRRRGTFAEFKEHTLAVARGERSVDPMEPRLWHQSGSEVLKNYSIDDLEDTRRRIEETEDWVKRCSERSPGLGWDHVKQRLRGEREAVEAEISRRLPP